MRTQIAWADDIASPASDLKNSTPIGLALEHDLLADKPSTDASAPPSIEKPDVRIKLRMSKSINNFELREADVVVRPALGTVGSAEFSARRKSIEAGRAAMLAALPKVRAALSPR